MKSKYEELRINRTMKFLSSNIRSSDRILDLGTPNDLSEKMSELGYSVENTSGEDLDYQPEVVKNFEVDVVTAFEIFEHLVSPFNVLRELPANKLVATVPLSLWFAPAYRSSKDKWDRHYHEFEDWQFDWLLEKAGWQVVKREKWNGPVTKLGIRPILRSIYPRFYAVYAERINSDS